MLEQELFDLLEGTADAAFTVTDQGEICSACRGWFGIPNVRTFPETRPHRTMEQHRQAR